MFVQRFGTHFDCSSKIKKVKFVHFHNFKANLEALLIQNSDLAYSKYGMIITFVNKKREIHNMFLSHKIGPRDF